jgi:hypothetical protein
LRRSSSAPTAPRLSSLNASHPIVWCADHADPDVFYLFEIYRDADAAQAAGQQPWFWAYLQAVGPLLDGQPDVRTATPAWTKGVPST